MRPFFAGSRLWPTGTRRLHVYALPDPSADAHLADLMIRSASVLAEHPTVAPVAPQWLHVTVQRVDSDVTTDQTQDLVTALQAGLTDIPAFALTAGPPLATTNSVLLDLDGDQPGEPWAMLTAAVRAAIASVLGPQAITAIPDPPHLTLAYGTGDTESGILQDHLRHRVRPARARLSVREVWLLDVVQDPARAEYRWTAGHRFPLTPTDHRQPSS